MQNEGNISNEQIIQQAYHLLHEQDFLHKLSVKIQLSNYKDLTDEACKKVDNMLKFIRQDFTKLMIVMNAIDRTYKLYQENKFPYTYLSLMGEQPLQEIGCQIEFLFAKYRVIIEYLESILKTVLVPTLSGKDKTEYDAAGKDKKDKQDSKFEWMTKYVANNFSDKCPVMNTEWFQNLMKTRNAIIHKGASCLVFGNKVNLSFNVYTPNDIQDDEEKINWDDYYKLENDLIRYDRYWGLYFAKLIVFCNAVLEFVNSFGNLSGEKESMISIFKLDIMTEFEDVETREKMPDVRDVPCRLLKGLVDE